MLRFYHQGLLEGVEGASGERDWSNSRGGLTLGVGKGSGWVRAEVGGWTLEVGVPTFLRSSSNSDEALV